MSAWPSPASTRTRSAEGGCVGNELDGPLVRRQAGFAIADREEQELAEPLVQQAKLHFVGRVGQGDRPPDELGGLPGGAREEGNLRSPGEDRPELQSDQS